MHFKKIISILSLSLISSLYANVITVKLPDSNNNTKVKIYKAPFIVYDESKILTNYTNKSSTEIFDDAKNFKIDMEFMGTFQPKDTTQDQFYNKYLLLFNKIKNTAMKLNNNIQNNYIQANTSIADIANKNSITIKSGEMPSPKTTTYKTVLDPSIKTNMKTALNNVAYDGKLIPEYQYVYQGNFGTGDINGDWAIWYDEPDCFKIEKFDEWVEETTVTSKDEKGKESTSKVTINYKKSILPVIYEWGPYPTSHNMCPLKSPIASYSKTCGNIGSLSCGYMSSGRNPTIGYTGNGTHHPLLYDANDPGTGIIDEAGQKCEDSLIMSKYPSFPVQNPVGIAYFDKIKLLLTDQISAPQQASTYTNGAFVPNLNDKLNLPTSSYYNDKYAHGSFLNSVLNSQTSDLTKYNMAINGLSYVNTNTNTNFPYALDAVYLNHGKYRYSSTYFANQRFNQSNYKLEFSKKSLEEELKVLRLSNQNDFIINKIVFIYENKTTPTFEEKDYNGNTIKYNKSINDNIVIECPFLENTTADINCTVNEYSTFKNENNNNIINSLCSATDTAVQCFCKNNPADISCANVCTGTDCKCWGWGVNSTHEDFRICSNNIPEPHKPTPTAVCANGTTGTPPDCKTPCHTGTTGLNMPDCTCDAGGTYPDCKCPIGSYGTGTPNCGCNNLGGIFTNNACTCPTGFIGTFPNCEKEPTVIQGTPGTKSDGNGGTDVTTVQDCKAPDYAAANKCECGTIEFKLSASCGVGGIVSKKTEYTPTTPLNNTCNNGIDIQNTSSTVLNNAGLSITTNTTIAKPCSNCTKNCKEEMKITEEVQEGLPCSNPVRAAADTCKCNPNAAVCQPKVTNTPAPTGNTTGDGGNSVIPGASSTGTGSNSGHTTTTVRTRS